MLNKLRVFAAVALVMLMFASCTKDETSMSINDLPERAKVQGTVYYSNAQKFIHETEDANAMLKDLFVAKGEVKVIAKIANEDILENAGGYTIFETTADTNGHYEFKIPVTANGLDIEIEALPFEGMKSTFDSLYRKQPQYSEKNGVFENAKTNVTLNPNDIVNKDIKYKFTRKANTELEENAQDGFTTTTLRVNVYQGMYAIYNDFPDFYTSDLQLDVKIEDGNNIDKTLKISNGTAVFDILHTTKSDMTLTVRVNASSSYQTSLQIPNYGEVQGSYKQFYSTDKQWVDKIINNVWESGFNNVQKITISADEPTRTINVYMMFKPDKTNSDFNIWYAHDYYEQWVSTYFRKTFYN